MSIWKHLKYEISLWKLFESKMKSSNIILFPPVTDLLLIKKTYIFKNQNKELQKIS